MARKSSPKTSGPVRARRIYSPDWPIVILGGLGLLVTGYLVLTSMMAAAPVGCGAGSSCDLIQQSRWSTLLGLPVALWGFGLYLIITVIAALGKPRLKRWQQLWALSFFGVVFSVYLTGVGWIELQALCWWCTTSLLILLAMFLVLTFMRPEGAPGMPWGGFILGKGLMIAVVLVGLHAYYNGWFEAAPDPKLEALAQHLDRSGAVFYGAFWCPSCQDQKSMFGNAADDLPYFECSPNGRNAGMAFECASENVTTFPTWTIGNRRVTGVQTPEDLARYSRFDWEGWQPD